MRKLSHKNNKRALGLLEIVIAVAIVVATGFPILRMLTKSRTDTASSINYLRAVELADEALEWASAANLFDKDENGENSPSELNLIGLSGPIMEYDGSTIKPSKICTTKIEYNRWKNSQIFKTDLSYSPQYANAFFYRDIKIQSLNKNDRSGKTDPSYSNLITFEKDMVKMVTVSVYWCEGFTPSNFNDISNESRAKKIELSLLVINDENLNF